jgi:hypothetical protein
VRSEAGKELIVRKKCAAFYERGECVQVGEDLGPKSGKSGLMDRTKNNGEAYSLS